MSSNIILKKSSIAARVPVTTDLEYGELALNYTDGALYYKRSDNTIQNLISSGGGGSGTVTSVTGTGTVSGLTLTGTVTTSGNITLGGTLAVTESNFASQTANTFLAAPNGSSGTPTFRKIQSADILKNVSIVSVSTITPTSDTADQYNITALAVNATIAIPSGSPINGQRLTIRIEDAGVAKSLSWTTTSGGYREIGCTLPTTTVASKVVYIGCIYNSTDLFWDVVSVAQQT